MNTKLIAGIVALLVVFAIGGYLGWRAMNKPAQDQSTPTVTPTPTVASPNSPSSPSASPSSSVASPSAAATVDLTSQVKSAHFVRSVPEHGSVISQPPSEVVLSFNFDLVAPSKVFVIYRALTPMDGIRETTVSTGETTISANRRELHQAVRENLSAGLYRVSYTACWPDTSCHDGQFEFRYEPS